MAWLCQLVFERLSNNAGDAWRLALRDLVSDNALTSAMTRAASNLLEPLSVSQYHTARVLPIDPSVCLVVCVCARARATNKNKKKSKSVEWIQI